MTFENTARRKFDLIQWPLSSSIYFGRKIGRNRFQVYENHLLYTVLPAQQKHIAIEAVNLA